MNIWVMRHGEAAFNAKTDKERTLTEYGQKTAFEQGQVLGKYFENQSVKLDKVLVSPYLRTQQTWANVREGIQAVSSVQSFANLDSVVETWDGITPSGSTLVVEDYLRFLQEEGAKNVLLISHLPLVYDLVEALTQRNASVHFHPAVIAEISWNGKQGVLVNHFLPAR